VNALFGYIPPEDQYAQFAAILTATGIDLSTVPVGTVPSDWSVVETPAMPTRDDLPVEPTPAASVTEPTPAVGIAAMFSDASDDKSPTYWQLLLEQADSTIKRGTTLLVVTLAALAAGVFFFVYTHTTVISCSAGYCLVEERKFIYQAVALTAVGIVGAGAAGRMIASAKKARQDAQTGLEAALATQHQEPSPGFYGMQMP
jgi:hypothetical protein